MISLRCSLEHPVQTMLSYQTIRTVSMRMMSHLSPIRLSCRLDIRIYKPSAATCRNKLPPADSPSRHSTTSSNYLRTFFNCIYGGSYRDRRPFRDQLVRQRPAHTIKKKCPFAVKAGSESNWTFETLNHEHNHPASASIDIAKLRQESITPEVRQFLHNEIDNRVKAGQLLLNLAKAFPDVKLLAGYINRLIYSRRAGTHWSHCHRSVHQQTAGQ